MEKKIQGGACCLEFYSPLQNVHTWKEHGNIIFGFGSGSYPLA
jgi:hypothetical protein